MFCTSFGQPTSPSDKFCGHCGATLPVARTPDLDELAAFSRLTDSQRFVFLSRKKDVTAGVLLCFFLGWIGAHQFYLGNTWVGVAYALFCWTAIPFIVSLVETFLMPERIRHYNANLALGISQNMFGDFRETRRA